MKRQIVLGVAFAAVAIPAFPNLVLAQNQTGMQQSRRTEISGKVVRIGDDDFVIDTGKKQVLIDAEDRSLQEANLSQGEQVTVSGHYDDDNFDAYTITPSNGKKITVRDD